MSAAEAFGAVVVGVLENGCAGGADLGGAAVVDVGRRHQGDAAVAVDGVVVGEEPWQKLRASWMEPKRPGKVGRYLRVLNCASL